MSEGIQDSAIRPLNLGLSHEGRRRTEDTDFFGCGVATWTSNRVEIFLATELPLGACANHSLGLGGLDSVAVPLSSSNLDLHF
jgi:hypothetical protein